VTGDEAALAGADEAAVEVVGVLDDELEPEELQAVKATPSPATAMIETTIFE
jgi:hypothetical protein